MKLEDLYRAYASLTSREKVEIDHDLRASRGKKKIELHKIIVKTLDNPVSEQEMQKVLYRSLPNKESAYSHVKRGLHDVVLRVLATSALRSSRRQEVVVLKSYLSARQLIERGNSESAYHVFSELIDDQYESIQAQLLSPFMYCEFLTWFGASRLDENMLNELKIKYDYGSAIHVDLFARQYVLKIVATKENQTYSAQYGHRAIDVQKLLKDLGLYVVEPDKIEEVSTSPFVVNLQYRLAILASRDYLNTKKALGLSIRYLDFLKRNFSTVAYHAGGHYTLGLSLYGLGQFEEAATQFRLAFDHFQGPNEMKFHCKHYQFLCLLNGDIGDPGDSLLILDEMDSILCAVPQERKEMYIDWLSLLSATYKICFKPNDFDMRQHTGMSSLYRDSEGWRFFIRCVESIDSLLAKDFPRFQLQVDSMRKHLYKSKHLDSRHFFRMERAYRWLSSIKVASSDIFVYEYTNLPFDAKTWIPYSWEIVPFDRLVYSFIKITSTPATPRR